MNQQIARKLRKQGHEFVTCEGAVDEFGGSVKTVKSVLDKPFFTWFWEVVLGNSSDEYRREFYRELHCGHTIGPSPISFGSPDFRSSSLPYARVIENDLVFRLVFLMLPGSLIWLLRHVLRVALRKMRRPSYYERERERRILLGITRRSIRKRKTVNREPTVDEIRAAWNGPRHSPEGALRLGGMLEDLECYVNNLTIGNAVDGYRGRRGGIKRHLQAKAPDLFEHYAALMRYKSIARKFRQACDVKDPNPADALLPMSSPPRPQNKHTDWSEQIKQSKDRASAGKAAAMSSTAATGPAEKRSEQIKRDHGRVDGRGTVVDEIGQGEYGTNWSEQIKRGQEARDGEKVARKEEIVVQRGVKSWVLDGFVFAWREDCWIRRESYETAIRVLQASENSVISLEAALALEIDPNFLTEGALERYGVQVEKTTERLKKVGSAKSREKTGSKKSSEMGVGKKGQVGPKKLSEMDVGKKGQVGPKKSSEMGVGKKGQVGPNESSGAGQGKMGKCRGLTRVAQWLRRRSCA